MPGEATNQMKIRDAFAGEMLTACITTEGFVRWTGLSHHAVGKATGGLLLRGYLQREERGCFTLTEAGKASLLAGEILTSGPQGPHTGKTPKRNQAALRDKAWRALRMMGKATIPDLMERASLGTERAGQNNLHRYLRALGRAGYVRELPRRAAGDALTSNGFKRWMLIRDTGPQAPIFRKTGIYDRNQDRLYAFDAPAAGEVQP
jgi:hypothetical protein